MNVLQICAYAAPYGGNFLPSLLEINKIILKKNGRVVYAFPETAKHLGWIKELQKSTAVYFLPLAKARLRLDTYIKIRKIIKNEKIDVIHSHFELYDIPTAIAAPKECKLYWHLHDSIERDYNQASIIRKLLYKIHYGACSKKAYLISVSENHRRFAVKLGMDEKDTTTVLNGLDIDRIEPYNHIAVEKTFDFLMFGWDVYCKGVDIALQAADRLYKAGYRFILTIVGTDNTWQEDIIKKYNDCPWLKKQGFVEDVNKLYQNSKCFLHISRSEGCSYALEEAMYSGMPIICSRISANMIASGMPTVNMIEPNDTDAVYSAMKEMIQNNYNVTEDSIKETRKYIEEKFSLSVWADTIYEIYLQKR